STPTCRWPCRSACSSPRGTWRSPPFVRLLVTSVSPRRAVLGVVDHRVVVASGPPLRARPEPGRVLQGGRLGLGQLVQRSRQTTRTDYSACSANACSAHTFIPVLLTARRPADGRPA